MDAGGATYQPEFGAAMVNETEQRFEELFLNDNNSSKCEYICGGCGRTAKIDNSAGIRCQHCGHRIFYKKRERKMLQYNAR